MITSSYSKPEQSRHHPALRLIAMLLRGPSSPLLIKVQHAVDSVRDSLITNDKQQISSRILHLLCILQQTSLTTSDPTSVCIALCCLKSNGRFKEANAIVANISQINQLMRFTVFLKLHQR